MKIKDLLDTSDKWIRGAYAKDAKGKDCHPYDNGEAVCWCLVGAIDKIYHDKYTDSPEGKILTIVQERGYPTIPQFNDDPKTTFEDIRNLLEELNV